MDSSPARSPAAISAAIAAGLAVVAGVVFAGDFSEFCLDDAYIHLAYARSLWLGDGLSYNPSDWETGFSSPLWLAVLALLPTGDAPWIAVKLAGIALHAGTAVLAALSAMALASRPEARKPKKRGKAVRHDGLPVIVGSAIAGALVALDPLLVKGAISGMEVSLTAFCLALLVWALVTKRWRLAFAAALLAVWARPEALFFATALAASAALLCRRKAMLAPAIASGLAFIAWIVYCQTASGHPFPNTYYAKSDSSLANGLSYLVERIAPEAPWLIGVTGLLLAGTWLWRATGERRALGLALVLAWLATLVATAATRTLNPDIYFYNSRYFAIVGFVPPILVGAAVASMSRRTALWLIPVAAALAWQLPSMYTRTVEQERGIRQLHTEPALYANANLPKDATVIVEGAGTLRYFTPRTMTIVDIIGLNDRALVHETEQAYRYCDLVRRKPTHIAVPDPILPAMSQLFRGKRLESFTDKNYAQVVARPERNVWLFEVSGPNPQVVNLCRQLDAKRKATRR